MRRYKGKTLETTTLYREIDAEEETGNMERQNIRVRYVVVVVDSNSSSSTIGRIMGKRRWSVKKKHPKSSSYGKRKPLKIIIC